MEYKASLDTQAKLITLLIFAIFGFVIYRNLDDVMVSDAKGPIMIKHSIISIILFVTLVIGYLFSIKNYFFDKSEVVIRRPIGKKKINISDIQEVRIVEKSDMRGTVRIFGNSGVFGYFGKFRNSTFGNFNLYATQTKNRVLIVTKDNKKMIISPDDLTFVDDLKIELGKKH